jgi:tetratricopeptide (TPR) repeat protein
VEFLIVAYVRRGLSYRRTGDTGSALADFRQAIDLVERGEGQRTLTDVYFYYGNALVAQGNLEQTRQSYKQFLSGKAQGQFGEGFGLQAEFSLWVRGNVALSFADCNQAIEADPCFAEALFCRGLLRQYREDWDFAHKEFQAAQRAAPADDLMQKLLVMQEHELDALQRQAQEKINPTRRLDKARFRPDIDYCSVDIALDGQGYIFVYFYGVDGERRESHDGKPYKTVLNDLVVNGWQTMHSQSHQEGMTIYLQRPKKV